jgi:hypothetical protein
MRLKRSRERSLAKRSWMTRSSFGSRWPRMFSLSSALAWKRTGRGDHHRELLSESGRALPSNVEEQLVAVVEHASAGLGAQLAEADEPQSDVLLDAGVRDPGEDEHRSRLRPDDEAELALRSLCGGEERAGIAQ